MAVAPMLTMLACHIIKKRWWSVQSGRQETEGVKVVPSYRDARNRVPLEICAGGTRGFLIQVSPARVYPRL